MKEAGDFAVHLKRCEKDIRTLKNATEGAFSSVGWVPCHDPLPPHSTACPHDHLTACAVLVQAS